MGGEYAPCLPRFTDVNPSLGRYCLPCTHTHARPCQVRFHPLDSDLFASGSLDHKVVVWRVSTGEKVFTHDFGASLGSRWVM
jgi:hypothetical protein